MSKQTDSRATGKFRRVQPVPMGHARWTKGFFADRFELCKNVILPRMREALEHPENSACLSNFRVGAGLEDGTHRGTNWSDGDCYKWLEALAHVYAVTHDPQLDQEMDYWIDLIARTQAEDGYISTQTQLNPKKKRWAHPGLHELYNMGHLMTAAAVHYQATQKRHFVEVAERTANYLFELFAPLPDELAHFGFNPSQIMGAVDLYRVTGNERYLELARIFVEMRGRKSRKEVAHGDTGAWGDRQFLGDQNQDRVPLREETEAVGHCVTGPYLWCGAADVVAESGDAELLAALRRIWHDVVERKMYVTGALGPYHHGISIRGDVVHEAFGRAYELPNATAYNETCANISNAMWNKRLLELTGDAVFTDVIERVMFNSGLSGMSLDGTAFTYTNPLARSRWTPMLSQDAQSRWTVFHCYCCPPQEARTLASLQEWIYGISENALWIHLYGGSELVTDIPGLGHVRLTQETDFPWDGKVTVHIQECPDGEWTLYLRIPSWAEGASLKINGTGWSEVLQPGSYHAIRRSWQAGDRLTLELPMQVRFIMAHPEVESAYHQLAVMRGPMVYCLEGVDLPGGTAVHEVRLRRRGKIDIERDPSLPGNPVILDVEGTRLPAIDWDGQLYAELPGSDPVPLRFKLIPYFMWLNRGQHEMRVWLPFE